MSRVGKEPIEKVENVDVTVDKGGRYGGYIVTVKGPKGELDLHTRRGVDIALVDNQVQFSVNKKSKAIRSLHGLYRTLVSNMVAGVVEGYTKELEMMGVGYKVAVKGNDLEFRIGLNHPILFKSPDGITLEVADETKITVSGIDKEKVGQVASKIRHMVKPDPYKGKGIYYLGERIRRKAGKAAKAEE